MGISVKVDPIDRDIQAIVDEELSPAAQGTALAAFAREQLAAAQETNRQAIGRVPPHDTYVDGVKGAALEGVKPGGVIVFEFSLVTDIFAWIGEMLVRHSPVKSGRYRDSHIFFADGVELAAGADVPPAREYLFMSPLPYARKIERGLSPQAPDGVYEAVTALARVRFGNVASVRFTYRAIAGGGALPAGAVISPGGLVEISRVGPLQVKRNKRGRFVKGSHVRAGNQAERDLRRPCILITTD
jgi:hypothetical protein